MKSQIEHRQLPVYMWGSRPKVIRAEFLVLPLLVAVLFHIVAIIGLHLMDVNFFELDRIENKIYKIFKIQNLALVPDQITDYSKNDIEEDVSLKSPTDNIDWKEGVKNPIFNEDDILGNYLEAEIDTGAKDVEPVIGINDQTPIEPSVERKIATVVGSEMRNEKGEGLRVGPSGGTPKALANDIEDAGKLPESFRNSEVEIDAPDLASAFGDEDFAEPELDISQIADRPDVEPENTVSLPEVKKDVIQTKVETTDRVLKPLKQDIELQFSVYREPNEVKSFFRLAIKLKKESRLPILRKNVMFLVDVSQSINDTELEETKNAVTDCIKSLNQGDKFSLIRFTSNLEDKFAGFVEPTPENIKEASSFLSGRRPGRRTDIYQVLNWAVKHLPDDPNTPVQIYLISDGMPTEGVALGSINDTQKIIHDFHNILPNNVSVFTFDAGAEGNRYLLSVLSYRSRGYFLNVQKEKGSGKNLRDFFRSHNNPVLLNVRSSYSPNLDFNETYPQLLPNLYKNRGIVIYGRCIPGEEVKIRVFGQQVNDDRFFDFQKVLPQGSQDMAEIARSWVVGKVHYLTALVTQERNLKTDKALILINEIKELGSKYNIWTPFTPMETKIQQPDAPGIGTTQDDFQKWLKSSGDQ